MLVTFNKAFLARVHWKGRGRVMKWLKCEVETCICWQLQNSYGQGTEAGKTCPACAMSGNKYCLMYTPLRLLLKETGMESQVISQSDISSESYLQVPYCWHRDFPGKKFSFSYPSDELLQNSITICFLDSGNSLDEVLLLAFFFLEGWLPLFFPLSPVVHLELLLGPVKLTNGIARGRKLGCLSEKLPKKRVGKSWFLHTRTTRRGKRGFSFFPIKLNKSFLLTWTGGDPWFLESVPAGFSVSQGHMQNPFLACSWRLKAKANFPCKWGLHVMPSIFLVKGDLRFLAPETQWFPQPFECGTVGSLAGKQNLISLERPSFPAWIAFFAPVQLLSEYNSKGKTKRWSYLDNLKLGRFYCL